MGQLYNLVKFRNDLTSLIEELPLTDEIDSKIQSIAGVQASNEHNQYYAALDSAITVYKNANQSMIDAKAMLLDKINNINADIKQYVDANFSSIDYQQQLSEVHITEKLKLTGRTEAIVNSRIRSYNYYLYPSLQILPRSRELIDQMVASDPLYLVDFDINRLKNVIKEYPPAYQNRLRLYKTATGNLNMLPYNQFGFALCWDNFNYLSLEKVERYIREMFNLLRPGGVFMFSYTNCDHEGATIAAENFAVAYCSANWVKNLAESIGYEVIMLHNEPLNDTFVSLASWAELRKPGELKTVKAHQAMGQVLRK